ncbi:hypothetical protein AXF42_Ash020634 [Apostasia shenzhenica]|uniref:Uncharacterized protein n=1 Tax=Apostasia shenzhenica TaxID=1088818 RepID=A0A2H9ZY98_9ASPA|nr:hypothetical protein AXF42_Ash020634 [Apostasia shenzhenica]
MKLASEPSFPCAAAYVVKPLIISKRSVDLQEEGDASIATDVAICKKKLTQPPTTGIHSATRSKQSQHFPPSLQITSALHHPVNGMPLQPPFHLRGSPLPYH